MKQVDFRQIAKLTGIFLITLIVLSCKHQVKKELKVTVENQFKNLFYADSNGITGADGIFSIPLPDGSSVFLLGDCFLGKVENGARDINTKMLRNAFIVIDKDISRVKALYKGTYDDPITFMEPENEVGDLTYRWYWPGHGFVKNDTIYVFALNLYNEPSASIKSGKSEEEQDEVDKLAENMFAFRISHIDLLSFSLPDFKHLETHKIDINYPVNQTDFGNCVMVADGYVYIYGTKNFPGNAKIHVARVPLNNRTFYNNWEYFTGTTWDKDIEKSVSIDIDISVSEQFSIFKYNDKYILLTQERAGTDIYTYVSDFPNKDFHNKKFIYHTTESESDSTKKIFSYNALAHAQYIENDQLLVSYCINSFQVRDVFENIEAYRAHFLRIPMQLILSEATIK
ncbi:MAG: hypothetical protein WC854_12790 [Bacteroidales bacterium]